MLAAGSAVFTIEPSATSKQAGTQLDVNLYVTASGANMFSGKVNINLTNATLVSFDPSGTNFGFSAAVAGGTAGSTSFEIASGYFGGNGTQGKLYMGRFIIQLASSAGTATIDLHSPQALEKTSTDPDPPTFDPMASTTQDKSITITAPAGQTCAPGQIGTYPNCSTPPPPPSGTNNPTTNPNTGSKIAVPPPTTDTSQPPEIIPEQQISDAYNQAIMVGANDLSNTSSIKDKLKEYNRWIMYGITAAVLLIIGSILLRTVINRARTRQALHNHVSSYTSGPVVTQNKPLVSQEPPPKPNLSPPEREPTIIKPSHQNKQE